MGYKMKGFSGFKSSPAKQDFNADVDASMLNTDFLNLLKGTTTRKTSKRDIGVEQIDPKYTKQTDDATGMEIENKEDIGFGKGTREYLGSRMGGYNIFQDAELREKLKDPSVEQYKSKEEIKQEKATALSKALDMTPEEVEAGKVRGSISRDEMHAISLQEMESKLQRAKGTGEVGVSFNLLSGFRHEPKSDIIARKKAKFEQKEKDRGAREAGRHERKQKRKTQDAQTKELKLQKKYDKYVKNYKPQPGEEKPVNFASWAKGKKVWVRGRRI